MPTNPAALPAIPPFPALADRATGTYNSKAYTWATEWDTIVAPALETLAETTYDNAVEGAASAVAAATSASTATTQANAATTQAGNASTSAAAAAASAVTAVNAPGTSGTSATSTAVGAGTKTLTTQTGKAWVVGQQVTLARTSDPANTRMWGPITAYNSGSGSISIEVGAGDFVGTGTHTDWTIGLAGQEGPAGADADLLMPWTARSGAVTLVQGDTGGASKLTSATVTFDTPAALGNGWTHVVEGTSGTSTFTASFADGSSSKKLAQGRTAYLACDGTAIRYVMFGQPGLTGGVTLVATSQTVALPVGLCKITAVGGGGGVSSVYPGGSGATCIKYIVSTGQNAVITIGAAGSGGSDGGATTVVIDGVTYTAGGGKAGGLGSGYTSPGDGGVATNGDINITGQPGTAAAPSDGIAGSGGSSTLGGGRRGGSSTAGGVSAAGYGGGGSQVAGSPQIGGNGVVVIEY